MSELSTSLRNQLGRVIVEARSVAEADAKRALESLAVGHHEPHGSMSLEERDRRVRLRAHGRQLGDVRDRQRGSQSIGRLTHEVAYEHWHRMLFARFLAENGLLIHPEHEVAMSVREIEELALESGQDPHQLASGFAQNSLPQIFRAGDPVLEVSLAPEARQKLEALLDSLPTEIFAADDSLGWTYQYWQTEKKDAVNASGEKIGADELPAVTQLFTEHYMVMFLYHNTLGAWHAGKVLSNDPSLAETAHSEDELRRAVALKTNAGDSYWGYLRFIREPQENDEEDTPTGPWRPASGTFDGWPKMAKELKVLDPCCGSGHFLVAGLKLLTRLRMLEEDLTLEDAINAVLRDNLFGLELDPRCTQIAAFNVALTAWRWAGKPIDLPALNIACSGLSIGSSKDDWLALAGDDERLQAGLSGLYELFRQAPELGSLIDPKSLGDDMFVANFEELHPLLHEALAKDTANDETIERAVAAQGMAKAAELLADEYTLVVTNVPFLARAKMSSGMRKFADDRFKFAKPDLATIFLARLLMQVTSDGTVAIVSPQNWYFLSSYKHLREHLLRNCTAEFLVRLGPNAFKDMNWWAATTALSIISFSEPSTKSRFSGCDLTEWKAISDKMEVLAGQKDSPVFQVVQSSRMRVPDHRFSFDAVSKHRLLEENCASLQGVSTADLPRFSRKFWEVEWSQPIWASFQSSSHETQLYAGREHVINLSKLEEESTDLGAAVRGKPGWMKRGIAIRQMRHLPATIYDGGPFDTNIASVIPDDSLPLEVLWAYCSSDEYAAEVRAIDQKTNVTNATLVKVPFDKAKWQSVSTAHFPDGLPEPFSDNPTQWLFHGDPSAAESATVLQVAVGRLLGYQWPPELDTEMRLAAAARDCVGRADELNDNADDDGIVCLPAIRSELPAADRLRRLLAAAYGSKWSAAKEKELLSAATGESGTSPGSLDDWLREKFFEEHCKLFHHRPFIWHIWDGIRDGFHCLINAHKLSGPDGEGRRTLEAITYSYLGDWIQRQRDDQKVMVEGADARLAAALDLQSQLKKILVGEPPYDLFIRWKALHEQAIGWEPDIDDGVRLNIRPFMNAELRAGGRRGAGLLRWKPNIKWKKDRGKEPESLRPMDDFPWFWGCKGDGSMSYRTDFTVERAEKAKFDGNRWNDLHYTRATKEVARRIAEDGEAAT